MSHDNSSSRAAAKVPRVAFYLRASSHKKTMTGKKTVAGDDYQQRPEIQEERLRQCCAQRGWQVAGVYCDRASGRKETRPELTRLMQDAHRGLFNVVAVAAFDRFARSSRHLILALDEFRSLGIDFVSLREAIDTSTPAGRLMYQIIAAMAEFESALISERTAAGMEYSRVHGTRSGRPAGRQRRIINRAKAEAMREGGMSYRRIAAALEVPVATLHAALQQYRPEKGGCHGMPAAEENNAPKGAANSVP